MFCATAKLVEIQNICVFIYSEILREGEGLEAILWNLMTFFLQTPCQTQMRTHTEVFSFLQYMRGGAL